MSTVESYMSFLEPWADKQEPPYIRGKTEELFPRTNFANQEYKVRIRDARPNKASFNLDIHGFSFHDDDLLSEETTEAIRARNKPEVERVYYPQVANLMQHVTGASKVIIFDHTYRKRDASLSPHENPNGREQPATLVSNAAIWCPESDSC